MADHRNALGIMGPESPTIAKGRRPVALAVAAVEDAAGPAVLSVPPAQLRRDGDTQYRINVDPAVVGDYKRLIADGDRDGDGRVIWPFRDPVEAVKGADTGDLWLVDGFQRLAAWGLHFGDSSLAAVPPVPVRVVAVGDGDGLRLALLTAAGSNSAHGAPRSDADKRNAVDRLLADPEWAAWSDREIARRAGVSAPFVAKRKEEAAKAAARAAAQRAGADVAGSLGHTPPAPAPTKRKFVNRHGGVSEIETANIGRKSAENAEFGRHAKGAAWGDRDSIEWGKQAAAAGNLAAGKLGGPAPAAAQPSTPPAAAWVPAVAPAPAPVDGLGAVHDHLVALVDALPLLRRDMADPASLALWQKLQAAVVPAVERVGAFLTAKE